MRTEKLFEKYLEGRSSQAEIQRLLEFFDTPDNEKALKAAIFRYLESEKSFAGNLYQKETLDKIHRQLTQEINKIEKL